MSSVSSSTWLTVLSVSNFLDLNRRIQLNWKMSCCIFVVVRVVFTWPLNHITWRSRQWTETFCSFFSRLLVKWRTFDGCYRCWNSLHWCYWRRFRPSFYPGRWPASPIGLRPGRQLTQIFYVMWSSRGLRTFLRVIKWFIKIKLR